jgi:hypothetical protein
MAEQKRREERGEQSPSNMAEKKREEQSCI